MFVYSVLESVAALIAGNWESAYFPLVICAVFLPLTIVAIFRPERSAKNSIEGGEEEPWRLSFLLGFLWLCVFAGMISAAGLLGGAAGATTLYVRFGARASWGRTVVITLAVVATFGLLRELLGIAMPEGVLFR